MPRVTQKGQVTIPRRIRVLLNIREGDEVSFEVEEEKVVLKKKRPFRDGLRKYVGFLGHLRGKQPEQIVDELRGKS